MSTPSAARMLGPDGPLARLLPGYEVRPQQVEMAQAVEHAFDQGGRLIVEAATGTGKTIAYLLPALLAGQRTIVSTATKTLQDQIMRKDIPLLRQVLARPFEAVLLKGRQNYACLDRTASFALSPRFRAPEERLHWATIEQWLTRTRTGDRAELADLPEDLRLWSELSVGAEACKGRDCPSYGQCFVMQARARAAEADLVVVNHHLFFADLALRQRAGAELLPRPEALIFDEAHHLEEIATSFFGIHVSNWRFSDLFSDVRRVLRELGGTPEGTLPGTTAPAPTTARAHAVSELERAVNLADVAMNALFDDLARLLGTDDTRQGLGPFLESPPAQAALLKVEPFREALATLRGRVMATSTGETGQRLSERIAQLSTELHHLLTAEDPELAYIIERRGRGLFLQGLPVNLQPIFHELLLPACPTQVFTSATLATDGRFSFFRGRMGLPEDTPELLLPPVFDYMAQSLLFVPDGLPPTNDPAFVPAIVPVIEELLHVTDGRAFLLFTSYRNMRQAHALLRDRIPWRVLMQGEAERGALLDTFRQDTRSVLFATASFWEGVDVQGEALSLVVIDKLPFASPADPLLQARIARLETDGGNGFAHLSVPMAVLALKQGFGRLIRHRDDRGIVAILDDRIITRRYGTRFLDSLPRARRTRDPDLVRRWWTAGSNP